MTTSVRTRRDVFDLRTEAQLRGGPEYRPNVPAEENPLAALVAQCHERYAEWTQALRRYGRKSPKTTKARKAWEAAEAAYRQA